MLGIGKVHNRPIDQLPLTPAAASSVKPLVLTFPVSTEVAPTVDEDGHYSFAVAL